MSLCRCHLTREARSSTSLQSTSSRSSRYIGVPGYRGTVTGGLASPTPGCLGSFHPCPDELALPSRAWVARSRGVKAPHGPDHWEGGREEGRATRSPCCLFACIPCAGKRVGQGDTLSAPAALKTQPYPNQTPLVLVMGRCCWGSP